MAQVIRLERDGPRAPAGAAARVADAVARPARCGATTKTGRPCRNAARANGFCATHRPPATPPHVGPVPSTAFEPALGFLARRVTGEYHVDPFGFDRELTERVLAPLVRPLYRDYFRTAWTGVENVPSDGPALVVMNHAGTIAVDALVLKFGLFDEHPAHRHLRLLAADLVFRMPFVAPLARKMGNTLGCHEDALALLRAGEVVGVAPEGFKGVGKPYHDRYHLQRFGRGGFVEVALQTGAPIVPVAIVGSEEIYPMIGNAKLLARLLGYPYFPITPTFPWFGPLGLVPLPSRWAVEFGEPIATDVYGPDAWKDSMLVFELTDRIRDTIQQMLFENVRTRRGLRSRRGRIGGRRSRTDQGDGERGVGDSSVGGYEVPFPGPG
jgi:1-acyl-sn-glycerol-3-phosphate acyltransferase